MNPSETIPARRSTTNSYLMGVTGLTVVSLSLSVGLMWWLEPRSLQFINPEHLPATLASVGGWGPVIYIAIISLSVVISQIPGAPLAIAAGAVWDPPIAGIYTVIGGFSGALIAYGLGRRIGQPIIKALTGKTLSFATDQGEGDLGWMIFVTRLLPIFSFDLVSYGAGVAGLSFPIYASATFLGMVPSTLLLTYLGDSLQLGGGSLLALGGFFLVAFVGMPLLLHRFNWLNTPAWVHWQ